MIAIPETEFLMGCESGREDERPAHRVLVPAFALAKSAITNDLYRCFVEQADRPAPPSWAKSNFQHPRQPVTSVSWFEAMAYCAWLSAQTGKLYRLPTEAEWECAARAGREGALYAWGDEPPESRPGYNDRWHAGPEPVGLGPPNSLGFYDLSENVHEWCSDWYEPGYYLHSPYRNPTGPETGARRSSRGGSWRHRIKIARVAARSSISPDFKYEDYGFRIALTL